MIRPEAKAQLMRWREVIVGAGAFGLGLWWLIGSSVLLKLPGGALAVAGVALIWIGLQRARFRGEGQGPGSVVVDEGEITYFGPMTGGAVALREMSRVTYDPTGHPAHWWLAQRGVPDLSIPVNAEGAEGLFDAFSTLPGFRMEQALQAMRGAERHRIVIWQRDLSISAQGPLH